MTKKVTILLVCLILTLGLLPVAGVSAAAPVVSVMYHTHVQDVGWQDFVSDGAMSGTSAQSKRLEGIEIKVTGNANVGIQYSTHVQDIGWQGFVADGAMSGTSGQSKRLEAIKIQLTGSDAALYDVYYRVHAQDYGWLGWAVDGAPSGTAGLSKRLEGIEIRIVNAGAAAPGSTANAYVVYVPQPSISYQTHVQDYGWQNYVSDGTSSGTSGESKRLEGIRVSISNMPVAGGITYRTQVQNYGWMPWVSDGAMSGTSGESKRLEAIQISLTGTVATQYDVYYRVHAQDFGWLGWAKNGASAGTEGLGKRLEAIQIVLVKKGSPAPSPLTGSFKVVTYKAQQSAACTIKFLNDWLLYPESLVINDISFGYDAYNDYVAVIDFYAMTNGGTYVRAYFSAEIVSYTPSLRPYLYSIDIGYVDLYPSSSEPKLTDPIFVNVSDIVAIPLKAVTSYF